MKQTIKIIFSITVILLILFSVYLYRKMQPEVGQILKSIKNEYAQVHLYSIFYGGANGGVDYAINVQDINQTFDFSKNIFFRTDVRNGIICCELIGNKLYIDSNISTNRVSFNKKNMQLDKQLIEVHYAKMNGMECINLNESTEGLGVR